MAFILNGASLLIFIVITAIFVGVAMPKQNSRIWALDILNLLDPTQMNLSKNVEGFLKFGFGAL